MFCFVIKVAGIAPDHDSEILFIKSFPLASSKILHSDLNLCFIINGLSFEFKSSLKSKLINSTLIFCLIIDITLLLEELLATQQPQELSTRLLAPVLVQGQDLLGPVWGWGQEWAQEWGLLSVGEMTTRLAGP